MKNIGFTRVNLQNHNEKSDFFLGGRGMLRNFWGGEGDFAHFFYIFMGQKVRAKILFTMVFWRTRKSKKVDRKM